LKWWRVRQRRGDQGAHDIYARVAFTGSRSPVSLAFASVAFLETTVSVNGNRLPYAAETLATVTLGYRHAVGVDVQLEAQHMGDQFGDDLNTIAGSADGQRGLIPALTLWNTAATWRVNNRSSFFVAIKNLADRTAIVDRARGILPTHPRLIQVGTSLRF
jgi:Fe(3+) dicitrate transport protein